jgi:hypothetical protein
MKNDDSLYETIARHTAYKKLRTAQLDSLTVSKNQWPAGETTMCYWWQVKLPLRTILHVGYRTVLGVSHSQCSWTVTARCLPTLCHVNVSHVSSLCQFCLCFFPWTRLYTIWDFLRLYINSLDEYEVEKDDYNNFMGSRVDVRTQKWHCSRYVRLKTESANLMLILYILLVWLGYGFYMTRGLSWEFWIWFHKEGQRSTWSNAKSCEIMGSSYQGELFSKMIKMDI